MKLLTITVPMYNVENYIQTCLDSFVIPEIMEELEVLVINDATPDGSRALAAEYEEKYPDTFRIIDKENGGHGSTINRGIEEAKGKYFKVVDGDDWVDHDGFLHLMEHLRNTDSDMVLSNYHWVDHSTGKKSVEVERICPLMEDDREYPMVQVAEQIFMKMHAVTYKTGILRNQPERLDEHCFYVDAEYMLFPLPHIKTVSSIPDFVYQYRIGLPGQSMNLENMKKRCGQHERVLNRLLAFYDGLEEDIRKGAICSAIARIAVSQYKIYLSFSESHKESLVSMENRLQKDYPAIYENMKNTAVLFLRKTGYLTYPLVSLAVRHLKKD